MFIKSLVFTLMELFISKPLDWSVENMQVEMLLRPSVFNISMKRLRASRLLLERIEKTNLLTSCCATGNKISILLNIDSSF